MTLVVGFQTAFQQLVYNVFTSSCSALFSTYTHGVRFATSLKVSFAHVDFYKVIKSNRVSSNQVYADQKRRIHLVELN